MRNEEIGSQFKMPNVLEIIKNNETDGENMFNVWQIQQLQKQFLITTLEEEDPGKDGRTDSDWYWKESINLNRIEGGDGNSYTYMKKGTLWFVSFT